ncbi:MAG: hypothetical protein HY691_11295 [Chloroflexi bacterium]|nr:hypothetical protein [Chloroflexota bacterium]
MAKAPPARGQPSPARRGPSASRPAKAATAKRSPRARVFTRDAALFKLIGIGESKIPGGISWRKHDLLIDTRSSD